MRKPISRIVLILLGVLIVSQSCDAQDKKFTIAISQQDFAGKPFGFQFWVEREADPTIASMELVFVMAESDEVRKRDFYTVPDISKLKGHQRIKLKPYSLPNLKPTSYPDHRYERVRADKFWSLPKKPAFVYQLVVTSANGKVVRSRAKTTGLVNPHMTKPSPSLNNGDKLLTHPTREVMAGKRDWVALTKKIKSPKPSSPNRKFCDLNNMPTKNLELELTSPIVHWVNSTDKNHFYVLEKDGLLRKVAWSSMVIENQIQLPVGESEIGTSRSFVIVTNSDKKIVWCLDKKSLEVKHVIPIDHCDRICSGPKSDRFLIYDNVKTSIVDLSLQMVTHTLSRMSFASRVPAGEPKHDLRVWFHDSEIRTVDQSRRIFNGGDLFLRHPANPDYYGYGAQAHLLAVSPTGAFFVISSSGSLLGSVGSDKIGFYETVGSRFPVRQFKGIVEEPQKRRSFRNRKRPKKMTFKGLRISSATISDIDQLFFLASAGEVHQFDISGEVVGKYQLGFDAALMIVSPFSDCVLAAAGEKAVRISLPRVKKYAIHEGAKLVVTQPAGDAADCLRQTKNLPLGSVSSLDFEFGEFVQNAVFHPNGKLMYLVNGDRQLLEIDVDDYQIKRSVDLQLPISDLTTTPKGIAVLLKTVRKAVILGWDDLQIVSSFRVADKKRLTGHENSEFFIASSILGKRVDVHNLAGERVQELQMAKILHNKYMENRLKRWPLEIKDFYFADSGKKVIGSDGRREANFELTPDGKLNLKSLVPPAKELDTFARSGSAGPSYEGLGIYFQRVGQETRIIDLKGNELLGWDYRTTGDVKPISISRDRSMLFGSQSSTCWVLKIADPVAGNVAVAEVVNVPIEPTPPNVWKSLAPFKPRWETRAKYSLISSVSHIFVGRKDDYHDVLAFDLETHEFLPQFQARKILTSPDGKFVLHEHRVKRSGKVALLDSNLKNVSPDVNALLSKLTPIPFFKNGSPMFLYENKHTGIFDPVSNKLQKFPDYFAMDYDVSRQQILARKLDDKEPLEFFWLDPTTGQARGNLKIDFLKPGESITYLRVSHDGKKIAVIKKGGETGRAILDLEEKKVVWESGPGRVRFSTLAWSQNDTFLLIGESGIVDVKNAEIVSQLQGYKSLRPIPNTDLVAGIRSDKRTIEIIDPIKKQVLHSIAKRKIVRISIKDVSEIGSKRIPKEYLEVLAWSFTRDGKFLVTLARPYKQPQQLFFFDVATGRHVKSFPLPRFE